METGDKKKNWKETLLTADVNPSASVWQGIEMQLDKNEVKHLRQHVYFYKMLAAACVAFALVAFGLSSWLINSTNLSGTKQTSSVEISAKNNTSNLSENLLSPAFDRKKNSMDNKTLLDEKNTQNVKRVSADTLIETNHKQKTPSTSLSFSIAQHQKQLLTFEKQRSIVSIYPLPTNSQAQQVSPIINPDIQPEIVALSDNDTADEEKRTDKKQSERFWTSVGFAAGTFNNTTPTNSNAPADVLQSTVGGQTAASETNSPGYTYSVNVAVGTKVSKRWLVQGGMSYITQLSDYTATSVLSEPTSTTAPPVLAAASINKFTEKVEEENTATAIILASSPYNVNSNVQLISFPVQAGFLVFERKMALQINSGVSTDLFLQNTITPDAENLEKTTQGRGDNSPYRPLNFSGLFGTELSYKFGDNYRVSLSPGLRYPFNSVYKNDLGLKSTPITFDVALRFRYIIK